MTLRVIKKGSQKLQNHAVYFKCLKLWKEAEALEHYISNVVYVEQVMIPCNALLNIETVFIFGRIVTEVY